ncbi:MAG: 7-cyano-7-deazaguanine synthase [Proteobacteria bacterium]|nr:7-cyano-7-deazaguanine synthase [Pseudomonadota bacterium]
MKLCSELGVPFEDTWSCYEGGRVIHCGAFSACQSRAEGFQKANIV